MDADHKLEDEAFPDEFLMCCKGKRCPTISPVSGGGLQIRESRDSARAYEALHTHEDVIVLSAEQATLLRKYLQQKGF